MAKLTPAQAARRMEERDGLDLDFSVVGNLAMSISARGMRSRDEPPRLVFNRFASISGRYRKGTREVASQLQLILMSADAIEKAKPKDGRFTLGWYVISKGKMRATIWAPTVDIALITGAPAGTWTDIRLTIERPRYGRGDIYGWSVDAGDIWPDDEDTT